MSLMEIFIDDIHADGLDISATQKDAWLMEAAREALGDSFRDADSLEVSLHIDKVKETINISGDINISYHPTCDRCLEEFTSNMEIPFHMVLEPLRNLEIEEDELSGKDFEKELAEEDMEYGHYLGDRFDLGNLVREQIILAQPMKLVCKKSCKGLCQRCGKNLNEGLCDCHDNSSDPRWSELNKIKEKLS